MNINICYFAILFTLSAFAGGDDRKENNGVKDKERPEILELRKKILAESSLSEEELEVEIIELMKADPNLSRLKAYQKEYCIILIKQIKKFGGPSGPIALDDWGRPVDRRWVQ